MPRPPPASGARLPRCPCRLQPQTHPAMRRLLVPRRRGAGTRRWLLARRRPGAFLPRLPAPWPPKGALPSPRRLQPPGHQSRPCQTRPGAAGRRGWRRGQPTGPRHWSHPTRRRRPRAIGPQASRSRRATGTAPPFRLQATAIPLFTPLTAQRRAILRRRRGGSSCPPPAARPASKQGPRRPPSGVPSELTCFPAPRIVSARWKPGRIGPTTARMMTQRRRQRRRHGPGRRPKPAAAMPRLPQASRCAPARGFRSPGSLSAACRERSPRTASTPPDAGRAPPPPRRRAHHPAPRPKRRMHRPAMLSASAAVRAPAEPRLDRLPAARARARARRRSSPPAAPRPSAPALRRLASETLPTWRPPRARHACHPPPAASCGAPRPAVPGRWPPPGPTSRRLQTPRPSAAAAVPAVLQQLRRAW